MQPPIQTPPDPFATLPSSIHRAEREHFETPGAMLQAAAFLDTVGSQWARVLHIEARAWQAELLAAGK